MKQIFILAIVVICSANSYAQKIEFEALEINYGDLLKGADGTRIFRFKNVGDAPLVINDVQKTCGCTSPSFTNVPVMPGEKGEILVKYDTQRLGQFTKVVVVHSNAKEQENLQLKIFGNIKEEASPVPGKEDGLFKQ
jgi:hypothetical protein